MLIYAVTKTPRLSWRSAKYFSSASRDEFTSPMVLYSVWINGSMVDSETWLVMCKALACCIRKADQLPCVYSTFFRFFALHGSLQPKDGQLHGASPSIPPGGLPS